MSKEIIEYINHFYSVIDKPNFKFIFYLKKIYN